MALNADGEMSMGGSSVGSSINLEINKSAEATIALNDREARRLAALTANASTISLYDFYGKSFYVYGQDEYTTPGTYDWVCPAGVTAVSVICVGGGGGGDAGSDLIGVGGGGGGGALAYRNNIAVTEGVTYTIVVGTGGAGQITINRTTTQDSTNGGASSAFSCIAGGGSKGTRGTAQVVIGSTNATGGQISGVYDGGAAGGYGGTIDTTTVGFRPPGGGGAAGYSGVGGFGGKGRRATGSPATAASFNGDAAATNSGGGGGGGAGYASDVNRVGIGANGGGVGVQGKGTTGAGGAGGTSTSPATNGGDGSNDYFSMSVGQGGGGGVGGDNRSASPGGDGAVRIVYPGQLRQFPSTGVANA